MSKSWREQKPSEKQLALCDELMDLGASRVELNEFQASIDAADLFIKKWIHLLAYKKTLDTIAGRVRTDEWGGIPNC